MLRFFENNLSEYEKQYKTISFYHLLKKIGIYDNMILCNNIINVEENLYDNIINGEFYDEESDEYAEIYQYFLFTASDFEIELIKENTNLLVFYSEKLDLYVLGVTHFGTSWDYVGVDCKYEIIKEGID